MESAVPHSWFLGGVASRRLIYISIYMLTTLRCLIDAVVAFILACRPGDVVFVPYGWHHAVLNLEPVVGLSKQLGRPTDLQPAFNSHQVKAGSSKWLAKA